MRTGTGTLMKGGAYPMKPLFARRILPGFLALALVGCSSIMPATKIDTILTNPREYADRTVTVSGTVEETFSLVVIKYFVLRDETGTIPVITRRTMPARGNEIRVTGTVQEAFSLGDQRLVVLLEK
jgi:hypothetical protein